MSSESRILRLYDESGNLQAVQIPSMLWSKIERRVMEIISPPQPTLENMEEFKALMASWDYTYPYIPRVACPACGAESADWQADNPRRFRLKCGNVGGLLVFHCENCGATIRHKYYKRHMEVEHTPRAK